MKKKTLLFLVFAFTAVIALMVMGCTDPVTPNTTPSPQQLADAFKAAHAAILAKTVDNVGLSDETAVNAALTAYDALNSEVQALLTTEKTKLDALHDKIEDLKTITTPQQLADAFKAAHVAILAKDVANVELTDETAVNAALTAYDALNSEVQALLTTEKTKLDALHDKIEDLKTTTTPQQLADAFKAEYVAILAKEVANVELTDEHAVNEALAAYNALSSEVQALLTAEKTKLDALRDKIEQIKTTATPQELADAFKLEYAAILAKDVANVDLTDEHAVNEALAAYGELSSEAQDLLADEKSLLDSLKAKIDELKPPPLTPQQEAGAFLADTDVTAALAKSVATVIAGDATTVNAALDAYTSLSPDAQALVSAQKYALDTLNARLHGWEALVQFMYPGALALGKTPEIDATSGHYPGIDPARTSGNVVRFTGALRADSASATPNLRYRINTDTIDLDAYEAVLVVTTISEVERHANVPTTTNPNINLAFRDHLWDMGGSYNTLNFYPSEGSGFPFGQTEEGLFFLGKSGAAYTTFANTIKGLAAGEKGFNIQNNADSDVRRTAFTLTIEAVVLLPKRGADVMDEYGPRLDGDEYILDPTLIVNSRNPTSESKPVFDWMVLSTDFHARLDLSPAISNAVTEGYTKLVIDYTILYSNRMSGTVADQFIALSKTDHGRTTTDEIARSVAVDRTTAMPASLEIALTGTNGSVTNMLEFVCQTSGRILFKINSMKLVK